MAERSALSKILDVAQRQDDCISKAQISELGVSDDAIRSLVERQVLSRVVRGVYVLGGRPLSDRQLLRTALLVAGPGSALSHLTSAALHGLVEAPVGEAWVTSPTDRDSREVTTELPAEATGLPATIHVVAASLRPDEVVVHP